jgi:LysR family transcriptional activator of glutamate synthase operon
MPTLLQLRYFRLLAQTQHITKTAQDLFITQTALSRMITQLESELGVALFDRIGRNIYLNDYGRVYLKYVNSIFQALDRSQLALETMRQENDRRISVAMASSSLWGYLIKGFQKQHPNYIISQQEFVSDNVHDRLTMLRLDFVIAGIDDLPLNDLEYTILRRDSVALCVPTTHRFAERKSIRLIEAKDEPFISLSPLMPVSRFYDKLCERAGFSPNTVIECDYTIRPLLIEENNYVALTTRHTADRKFFGQIAYIPLEDDFAERITALFWFSKRKMSQAARISAAICWSIPALTAPNDPQHIQAAQRRVFHQTAFLAFHRVVHRRRMRRFGRFPAAIGRLSPPACRFLADGSSAAAKGPRQPAAVRRQGEIKLQNPRRHRAGK